MLIKLPKKKQIKKQKNYYIKLIKDFLMHA